MKTNIPREIIDTEETQVVLDSSSTQPYVFPYPVSSQKSAEKSD